jgi:SOS-response transcriptional repressor LexA
MPRNKEIKISPGFENPERKEEFFRLPRVEFLLNEADKGSLKGIERMVVNERLEISDRFSMEVPDNRMEKAGICKGDHVVIQKRKSYRSGDVLALKLGDKAFIRRYFPGANHRIRLECGSPQQQTMILDSGTPGFSILGCVVQVIREI